MPGRVGSPARVVAGLHEGGDVCPERVVAAVVAALDGGILDRAAHALDLTMGPRVVDLGQPVDRRRDLREIEHS